MADMAPTMPETGRFEKSQPQKRRSAPANRPRVYLCGIPLDSLGMHEIVATVEQRLDAGERTAIGVVNVAKIVNMQRDRLLRESVTASDVVLADGAPLVWLSRLKRTPLPERVAGIDLMFELFKLANRRGYRVFLLGAQESTLHRVVEIARRDYPGMVVAGYQDGYFPESQEESVARAIRNARADMLFVAMSSPKKEIFLNKWAGLMGTPVSHGVGGSFDVMAGVTCRAPRWMQRAGLEWFYRVIQEPRRMWKRYLVTNTLFLGMAFRDLFKRHNPAERESCRDFAGN